MTQAEWIEHLLNATGPLAIERIEELEAEPELIELLRELAARPWTEDLFPGHPAGSTIQLLAMMVLGFARDAGSVPLMLEQIRRGYEEDIDDDMELILETVPNIIAAIGPGAVDAVVAEIALIEKDPAHDPRPLSYEWRVVETLSRIAADHPEISPVYVEMATERILDTAEIHVVLHEDAPEITRAEIWLSSITSSHYEELAGVIDEFFARREPSYCTTFIDPRDRFIEITRTFPNVSAHTILLREYSMLREDVDGLAWRWEIPAEQWIADFRNEEGPFVPGKLFTLVSTPTLLRVLHDQLASPWPDADDTTEAPFLAYAALILGYLEDRTALPLRMASLYRAVAERREELARSITLSLLTMGRAASSPVLAEIERAEREPGYDPDPPQYQASLVGVFAGLAAQHSESRRLFVAAATTRIDASDSDAPDTAPDDTDAAMRSQHALARAELWIHAAALFGSKELEPVIERYFARRGAGYSHPELGNWKKVRTAIARNEPIYAIGQIQQQYDALRMLPPDPAFAALWREAHDSVMQEYASPEPVKQIIRDAPRIGRNDPCPCGSGKKYKKCCGK